MPSYISQFTKTLGNSIYWQGKKTDGSILNLLGVDSSNIAQVGNSSIPLQLNGSNINATGVENFYISSTYINLLGSDFVNINNNLKILNNHMVTNSQTILSWDDTDPALAVTQYGDQSSLFHNIDGGIGSGSIGLSLNTYYDGTNWKYGFDDPASRYYQQNGKHYFECIATGIKDNNITWANNVIIGITGLELYSTQRIQFRDTDVYINSDTDGLLDLHADNYVNIASKALRISRSYSGGDNEISINNQSTDANSNSILKISTINTGLGDALLHYSVGGLNRYIGIDNSDSESLKFSINKDLSSEILKINFETPGITVNAPTNFNNSNVSGMGTLRCGAISSSGEIKGDYFGGELIVNGAGITTTGWTEVDATLTVGGGNFTVTNTSAGVGSAYQAITTVIGKSYTVTANFVSATSTSGWLAVGTSVTGAGRWNLGYNNNTTAGVASVTFTAISTTTYVHMLNNSATVGHNSVWNTVSLIVGVNTFKIETTSTATDSGKFAGGISVAGDIYTTALTAFSQTFTSAGTIPTFAQNTCLYKVTGKTVHVWGRLQNSSGGTAGSGSGDMAIVPPVAINSDMTTATVMIGTAYSVNGTTRKEYVLRAIGSTTIYGYTTDGGYLTADQFNDANVRELFFTLTYEKP